MLDSDYKCAYPLKIFHYDTTTYPTIMDYYDDGYCYLRYVALLYNAKSDTADNAVAKKAVNGLGLLVHHLQTLAVELMQRLNHDADTDVRGLTASRHSVEGYRTVPHMCLRSPIVGSGTP